MEGEGREDGGGMTAERERERERLIDYFIMP